MGAVGGSRFYQGGGLGNESGWSCPSCGAENAGPIAGGCSLCGAGRPGYRAEAPPPPPPAAEPRPREPEQPNFAQAWILRHPEATLEEAFTAGYITGIQVARRELAAQPRQAPPQPHPLDTTNTPEERMNRTIAAALELFRDQVLSGNPEEIKTGEWMSVDEVNALLRQLRAHIDQTEAAHA